MPIKLFIGTSLTAGLAERIAHAAGPLTTAGTWRWSPQQQWHITSLFIGQREETELQAIARAIGRTCADHGPITLHDGHLATMPVDRPSMLWVRFRPSAELSALHLALAGATSTPPSPHQPYVPHITLARGRSTHGIEGDPVLVPSITLQELTLFRSDPGPSGTIHSPLGSWMLATGHAWIHHYQP